MKAVVAAVSVVLATLLVAAPAVWADGGSASATPLRIKVTSVDSKAKVKVARDLKVLVSCSRDCRIKARITLKTPINSLKVSGSELLGAGDVWTTGIRLTNFGLNYLKKNYRKSVLKVALTATDTATGKKAAKTRSFRLHR